MDWESEREKLIDWTYGGSWTSEIPLLLFIEPHLSGPSPHGFPSSWAAAFTSQGGILFYKLSLVRLSVC